MSRALRLAGGPDEVHRQQIGKLEMCKYAQAAKHLLPAAAGQYKPSVQAFYSL
jgi:hypothetical protein